MNKNLILILGSTGQLGSELLNVCRSKSGWQIEALSHHEIEITDNQALHRVIGTLEPGIVLNCTAYNFVDAAQDDPLPAFAVNSAAVASLARVCQEVGSLLVHFSTDYVFDGKSERPYQEQDTPTPLNIYGLSKLAGEQAIRLLHPYHCIVRTCGLYGKHRSPRGKLNFVERILSMAKADQLLKIRNDLVCAPTEVSELAQVVCQLLESQATGTFHITNTGSCSWYEFARQILRIQGIEHPIEPVGASADEKKLAPRPHYSVLNTTKFTAEGIRPMASWQEALATYLSCRSQ